MEISIELGKNHPWSRASEAQRLLPREFLRSCLERGEKQELRSIC